MNPATTGITKNGGDEQGADETLPEEFAIEQDGEARPHNEGAKHRHDGHLHADPGGIAEELVAGETAVVLEADELTGVRSIDAPLGEAVEQREQERDLRHEDREDQSRKNRQPTLPPFTALQSAHFSLVADHCAGHSTLPSISNSTFTHDPLLTARNPVAQGSDRVSHRKSRISC